MWPQHDDAGKLSNVGLEQLRHLRSALSTASLRRDGRSPYRGGATEGTKHVNQRSQGDQSRHRRQDADPDAGALVRGAALRYPSHSGGS
jgi:hypothetical protein